MAPRSGSSSNGGGGRGGGSSSSSSGSNSGGGGYTNGGGSGATLTKGPIKDRITLYLSIFIPLFIVLIVFGIFFCIYLKSAVRSCKNWWWRRKATAELKADIRKDEEDARKKDVESQPQAESEPERNQMLDDILNEVDERLAKQKKEAEADEITLTNEKITSKEHHPYSQNWLGKPEGLREIDQATLSSGRTKVQEDTSSSPSLDKK